MYPDSALSAAQLAVMAVVVAVSLAAWLILMFLAARQPRGTSAAVNAGPHEEETAATVTSFLLTRSQPIGQRPDPAKRRRSARGPAGQLPAGACG